MNCRVGLFVVIGEEITPYQQDPFHKRPPFRLMDEEEQERGAMVISVSKSMKEPLYREVLTLCQYRYRFAPMRRMSVAEASTFSSTVMQSNSSRQRASKSDSVREELNSWKKVSFSARL